VIKLEVTDHKIRGVLLTYYFRLRIVTIARLLRLARRTEKENVLRTQFQFGYTWKYKVSEKSLFTCKKCIEPISVLSCKWKVVQEVEHVRLMYQLVAVSCGSTRKALKNASSYIHTR